MLSVSCLLASGCSERSPSIHRFQEATLLPVEQSVLPDGHLPEALSPEVMSLVIAEYLGVILTQDLHEYFSDVRV